MKNKIDTDQEDLNDSPKSKKILYLIIIIIALLVIVGTIITLIVINKSGENKKSNDNAPEDAVKGYISGYNDLDTDELLEYCDLKGEVAWNQSEGDIDSFKDFYKDVDEEDIESHKKMKEYIIQSYSEYFNFSMKLDEIEEVEKIENCEDLYEIRAKVTMSMKEDEDQDENKSLRNLSFMVYKNKVISME